MIDELSPHERALFNIAMLDEADGHELREEHAFEAVAIAMAALGIKRFGELVAAYYDEAPLKREARSLK
jgi:hypothetical protein